MRREVAAVVLVILVATSIGAVYLVANTSTKTVSAVSTSTSTSKTTVTTSAAICLLEVPSDANIMEYHNSTTVGNFVTHSNGTKSFFDAASCPQPAPPSIYKVASLVVSDPRFIKAENGSAYYLDVQDAIYTGPLQVTYSNGTTLSYSTMRFIRWGTPPDPIVAGCGGKPTPISLLTTRYFEAATLEVKIPNLNVVLANGVPQNLPNGTSDLNFSQMQIEGQAGSSINGFHCTVSG